MQKLKKILLYVVTICTLLISVVYITGNNHLLLGIYDTYLQGRTKPGVEYSDIFAYREMQNQQTFVFPKASETEQNYLESTDSIHKKYGTLAYLVIHNDTIIHEKYFENYYHLNNLFLLLRM